MTEQEKKRAIRLYFTPFPRWSLGIIAFGVICLGTGEVGGIVLGVLFIGVGGAVLVIRHGMISDAEYDRLRNEALWDVSQKAADKWHFDPDELTSESVRLFGPAFGVKISTWSMKKGRDRIIRFNPIRFAVIGFGEHQMLAYTGLLDMVTGNVLNEETKECPYRHVALAATSTDSIEFTHRGETHQLDDTETFVLTTSAGTSLRVPIRSRRLAELFGEKEMPARESNDAVAAVIKMWREKTGNGVPI
jgi:hypothetical protein